MSYLQVSPLKRGSGMNSAFRISRTSSGLSVLAAGATSRWWIVEFAEPTDTPWKHAVRGSKDAMISAHRRGTGMVCLVLLAVFVIAATKIGAQEGRTPTGSSPVLDENGYPPQPKVLRPTWRSDAEKRGITFVFDEIYDFQGNPSGGRTQMGTVNGRATGIMNLDLQKLVHWKGAKINASGIFQTGSDLALTYIEAYAYTSSVAGTHTLRFNEYYLEQTLLSKKLTLEAGQLTATTEFDNQAIGFDDKESTIQTWVNLSLACHPLITGQVFAPFPPVAKPGFLVLADPSKSLLIKVGVYDASHSPYKGDESGIRFDLRDAPLLGLTLGWHRGDETLAHPGIYKVGLLHNFGTYQRQVTHSDTHGDDIPFIDIGQALWRMKKADGSYSHAGIDGQFSISTAPRALNQVDAQTLGGVRFVGVVPHRPADIQAVGLTYTHYSRDYRRDLALNGMPDRTSQTNLEANYKFVLSRWLSVWPNFQYVWKPSGERKLANAPVLALRVVFDH